MLFRIYSGYYLPSDVYWGNYEHYAQVSETFAESFCRLESFPDCYYRVQPPAHSKAVLVRLP